MKIGNWTIRSPVAKDKRGVSINGKPIHQYFLEGDGCPVGYVNLVNVPEIQTAANRIADLVSSMTVQLMENTELGDVRVKNELARMVDVTPNRFCNHKELYHAIVRNMVLDGNGNCIIYPKHDRNGLLVDLIPFDMSQCSILPDTTKRNQYGYRVLYQERYYKPDEILHFRANPDPQKPWIGTGFRVCIRDLAKNLAQAQKTKRSFMEAPKPTLIVSMDALTDELDSADGRRKLADKYLSETDGGIPWFIPEGLIDVKEIKPLTLQDIAINESVTIDKQTAASIFGVPPFLVGVGDFNRDTYNNFIRTTIRDYALIIAQEMTRKLLYNPNWYFRLNHRSLLAFDFTETVNGYTALLDRLSVDRNEVRDAVGLSPREDMVQRLALENWIPEEALGMQNKLGGGVSVTEQNGQVVEVTETDEPIKAQQLTAITKIIEMVQDGTYSKDAAVLLFEKSFPQIDEDTARKLIEGVNPRAGGNNDAVD